MFNRNGKQKYNQQMMNRAITSGTLRVVVAGYIIFIAVNLINGTKSETSSIPAWAGTLIGFIFIAASAGFIIYAIRSFLKAMQNARLDAEEAPQEEKLPEVQMSIAEKVRSAEAMLQNKRSESEEQAAADKQMITEDQTAAERVITEDQPLQEDQSSHQ